VGTVRMEAFIDKSENEVPDKKKAKSENRSYRTRQGNKKNMSYWGVAESMGNSSMGREPRRAEDPFRGF